MKLNDGLYFWLKYLCIIVLPALSSFIVVISKIWNWADTGSMVAQTITAFATFLVSVIITTTRGKIHERHRHIQME